MSVGAMKQLKIKTTLIDEMFAPLWMRCSRKVLSPKRCVVYYKSRKREHKDGQVENILCRGHSTHVTRNRTSRSRRKYIERTDRYVFRQVIYFGIQKYISRSRKHAKEAHKLLADILLEEVGTIDDAPPLYHQDG